MSGLEDQIRELVREEVARALAEREPADAAPSVAGMTTVEAAAYLKVSPVTLEQMRHRGKGPKYVRAGRRVLYRREDVEAWIAKGGR